MTLLFIVNIVRLIARVLVLIIIADVIVSYFLSPYHKIRMTLDRIVQPMLSPIRRYLPSMGGIDFSPIVLLFAIQIIEYVIIRLLMLIN